MAGTRRTKGLKSSKKANIKRCHFTAVVKGCLHDDLEVVASPEVACRFRYDPNHCAIKKASNKYSFLHFSRVVTLHSLLTVQ